MSYRVVIVSWRIVMRTMCERNILLGGRISVHIMSGKDVCWYCGIVEVQEMSERLIIVSWRIVVYTLCEGILLS